MEVVLRMDFGAFAERDTLLAAVAELEKEEDDKDDIVRAVVVDTGSRTISVEVLVEEVRSVASMLLTDTSSSLKGGDFCFCLLVFVNR